ncbi:Transporter, UAA family protein [Giardia duodenalis]|uniref:Transporter, UAA family protein n=1 Tax=Giardia intestinalis TaxID=5741 RepID=V6TFL7_GIAIN|nr:Transporter, UAA family protein [Giardia intestinalis]
MNETVRFLLIVGSIYVCHVANSYLAETLYTSPPHKIDVRWIGLIFEGVWSIIFAEVYRMVSKTYDGYGAKKTEGGVEDSAKDGARGEPAPSNSNSVNVSGVVEHTTSKTTRKTLRVHEFFHALTHPDSELKWAQSLIVCEILLALGKVFSLLALKYVSYTTSMVFKSSKTLGILMTALLLGNVQHITPLRILTVIAIVSGSLVYSHAELRSYNGTTPHPILGYILMLLSELCNGFGCTYQDISVMQCKRETGMLIKTNIIQLASGVCTLIAGIIMTGIYNSINDIVMLSHTTSWIVKQNLASIFLTLGLIPIIYSLKLYGSLLTGIISTVRKLITVVISMFMTNTKPTTQNWIGIGLTFTGLTVSVLESKIMKVFGANSRSKNKKQD